MIHHPPTAAFLLRRLGSADAAQYRALRLAGLRAFPHAFRPSVDEALAQPLSWAEARLAKEGEYWFGAFDGALEGNPLVGAICLRTQEGAKIRHAASLNALVVDPAAPARRHRRRAGRAPDRRRTRARLPAPDHAHGPSQGNTAAERLYDRFGFAQFGLEPDAFLHDGQYYAKQHRQLSLVTPQS